jgi:hypothetical protein
MTITSWFSGSVASKALILVLLLNIFFYCFNPVSPKDNQTSRCSHAKGLNLVKNWEKIRFFRKSHLTLHWKYH